VKALAIVVALARFYCRAVPARWFRKAPYLPVPARSYLRWRLETAYGYNRPSSGTVLRDLWQFGAWLVASGRESRRLGRET